MRPEVPAPSKPPDGPSRTRKSGTKPRRESMPKVGLEVAQHGSLLTPPVLAVLYDIIEASHAATKGRDDGDMQAS